MLVFSCLLITSILSAIKQLDELCKKKGNTPKNSNGISGLGKSYLKSRRAFLIIRSLWSHSIPRGWKVVTPAHVLWAANCELRRTITYSEESTTWLLTRSCDHCTRHDWSIRGELHVNLCNYYSAACDRCCIICCIISHFVRHLEYTIVAECSFSI